MGALTPKGSGVGGGGGVTIHSDLIGLQGGAVGEYYHLTAAEYALLASLAAGAIYEPVLASGNGNQDVAYVAGTNLVPDFLTSASGDIIMSIGVQNAT